MPNIEKNLIGVYKIKNLITGQIYIGSSMSCIASRWKSHIRDLKKNKHHSNKLQNSWNKYGFDNFEFTIVEICEENDILSKEQYFLDNMNPFYNICKVAGNCKGRVFSEESRKKMSISAKKRGLNTYLLNQQISKAKFNDLGEKECSICLKFVNIELFRKNTSKCKICFNKKRPSRKIEGRKELDILKRGTKIKVYNDNIVYYFNSIRQSIRELGKETKLNKTHVKRVLNKQKLYYNFYWETI